MIEFKEKNATSHEVTNSELVRKGVFIRLAIKLRIGDFIVDKQIQPRAGIGRNVSEIQLAEGDRVSVPVLLIL